MNKENDELTRVIKELAKKKEVLTQGAVQAKQEYDQFKENWSGEVNTGRNKVLILEEFNENVAILCSLFRKARFEEFLRIIANPGRLFFLNFLVGFFWALGLVAGLLVAMFIFRLVLTF
jgi:hypothetical protein